MPDAATIWRDFASVGEPASGVHQPDKAEIRALVGLLAGARLYATRADAEAETVAATVSAFTVAGASTAGDGGGAAYVRRGSEPAHAGKLQTADGAWWELVPESDGSVPVHAFGDPDDAATLVAAFSHGSPVRFPAGTFSPGAVTVTTPVSMVLEPGAYLDADLTIAGEYAVKSGTSVAVVVDWASAPAGTTSFSGDFSAFAPGDVVLVELPDTGDADEDNQTGIDFLTVDTASASAVAFTSGTRFPYRNPVVSKITNAVQHTGTLARDAITISGDYTAAFAAGDIVRIENIDGTGGVEASDAYFELVKVAAIDSSEITLESNLTHTFIDPWLVKVGVVDGVRISGRGRINRLVVKNAAEVYVEDVEIDRLVTSFCYRGRLSRSYRRGLSEPSTSNLTFCWHFQVSNVYCGGASSSSDNAAFKVLGCPNLQMVNVSGGDTTASAQGCYGVFVDYFFTPYKVWNENLQARNIRAETPNGGTLRASWFTGVRGGTIDVSGGRAFFQNLVDTTATATCPTAFLEVQDCVRCRIRGDTAFVSWSGCWDSIAEVTTRGTGGASANRCFWAKPGVSDPETGVATTIGSNNEFNVVNYSTTSAETTLYIQSQTEAVIGAGCRDKAGLANSVVFGSSVTTPICMPCLLRNAMPSNSAWASARVKGYLHFDGNWRDGGLRLGDGYLWTDASGDMRVHTARPTADSNGVVVGSQS